MLNLPIPPQTRISRQLTCISCREAFIIAEDDPIHDEPHTNNWQMPRDIYPDVKLRYEPDRSRRPVMPEANAVPGQDEQDFQEWDAERRDLLNCPRCGADNRNWFHLSNFPTSYFTKKVDQWLTAYHITAQRRMIGFYSTLAVIAGFGLFWLMADPPFDRIGINTIIIASLVCLLSVFIWPAPIIARVWSWWRKFGIASAGIGVTALLVLHAAYTNFAETRSELGSGILLLFSIFMTGVVSTLIMVGSWRSHREFKAFRAVVPAKSTLEKISPPIKIWLGFTTLFLVVVPVFFFVLVPSVFHIFSNVVEPESKPEPVKISLDEEIKSLQGTFLLFIIRPEMLEQISQTFGQSILEKVDESLAAANESKNDLPDWLGADETYFRTWFRYVMVASIAVLVFVPLAIDQHIRSINRQVPPPLFHSIANMTRVVVWEAKHALEIGDEAERIQWTAVNRNELGGIDLMGFYFGAQQPNQKIDLQTTKILAEQYQIKSDRWGHVIEANVRPARVMQRPQRSPARQMALGDELFGGVSKQTSKRERP
jgi:hypothetical protein